MTTTQTQRTWSRKRIDVDPARLEEAAAAHAVQREVAAALGMSHHTLVNKLLGSQELRRAYDRGRSRREAAHPRKARAASRLRPEPLPAAPEPGPPAFSPPPPRFVEGADAERVLAAVGAGCRTMGALMTATGMAHHQLVLAVERLACGRRVHWRTSGGERRLYLYGEAPPKPEGGAAEGESPEGGP